MPTGLCSFVQMTDCCLGCPGEAVCAWMQFYRWELPRLQRFLELLLRLCCGACTYTQREAHRRSTVWTIPFLWAPGLPGVRKNLATALKVYAALGNQATHHKLEGLLSAAIFLEIEIDTIRELLHLPEEKLLRLRSLLKEWLTCRSCTKRELSMIGVLHRAVSEVKSDRKFVR